MSDLDLGALAPKAGDATEEDTLPMGRNFVVDSGVRNMIIDMAYMAKSTGGALGLNVHLKDVDSNFVQKERIWLTSGDAKGNRNTYTDGEGQEKYLPGYLQGNSLAKLATGKAINEQDVQKKTIKLWDFDQNAEVPTEVDCVVSMLKQPVKVGIIKVRENKRALSGGNWIDTNEPKEKNEVERFFDSDGRTSQELKAGEPAEFIDTWRAKYDGQMIDRFKPVDGAPVAPAPDASGTDEAPLFS